MVEFTREDVERIAETHLMVKDLKEDVERGYSACTRCIEDHEDRLRKLERWQWKLSGIASGIGAAAGTMMGLIFGKGGS
jgi:hypothetical protein